MEPKSEHSPRRNLQVLSSGRWRHGCTTPVPTSAPIAAPVPPVIPLHALSLPLRKVEAGRNRDDTLMHDVGDPHFIGESIVVHTHTIVRLGASFGSPVHARPGSPKRGLEDLEKKPVATGTHQLPRDVLITDVCPGPVVLGNSPGGRGHVNLR
jgi:hypothetical protein